MVAFGKLLRHESLNPCATALSVVTGIGNGRLRRHFFKPSGSTVDEYVPAAPLVDIDDRFYVYRRVFGLVLFDDWDYITEL